MDPFVQRLILRLHHPSQPLSRNRHFATFDTPEGRAALRISRRLKSLQKVGEVVLTMLPEVESDYLKKD